MQSSTATQCNITLMASCKTAVTPLLMHWSYCSLVLTIDMFLHTAVCWKTFYLFPKFYPPYLYIEISAAHLLLFNIQQPITHQQSTLHQFSHNYLQKTPHSSPVRAMFGVPFVDPASDFYSASVLVIVYVISYNIGPCYNSTHLHWSQEAFFTIKSRLRKVYVWAKWNLWKCLKHK